MSDASPAGRLHAIDRALAQAAARANRSSADVAVVAVSKTQPPDAIVPLIHAGHRRFGENRVQEAMEKWPALRAEYPDIELHLVGRLQSNKAEEAVRLFDVFHSLDRPSLVDALGAAAARVGRSPACFLQVNIGDEPQKGGCAPAELPTLIERAGKAGLQLTGLMCLPPEQREPAPYFALLAKLAARHGLSGLSMGMSSDYGTAVAIGATHVRIGTALFGARAA